MSRVLGIGEFSSYLAGYSLESGPRTIGGKYLIDKQFTGCSAIQATTSTTPWTLSIFPGPPSTGTYSQAQSKCCLSSKHILFVGIQLHVQLTQVTSVAGSGLTSQQSMQPVTVVYKML